MHSTTTGTGGLAQCGWTGAQCPTNVTVEHDQKGLLNQLIHGFSDVTHPFKGIEPSHTGLCLSCSAGPPPCWESVVCICPAVVTHQPAQFAGVSDY